MASTNDSKRVASTRPVSRRGVSKSEIRKERRMRSQARRRRRRTLYASGGGLLALIFILSLTLGPGLANNNATGDGGGINTGGPVTLDPDDGRQHLPTGQFGSGYSVRPATSGLHWFASDTPAGVSAPAPWGVYDFPLPDEVLIHNLEHGGIGFHYDCPDGCLDVVNDLEHLLPRNRSQFIMSPYSGMEKRIAITAWRHHLFLDEVDEARILEFIDEYQDRAPESVP
jgi:hypothetical protein